uniref:uncharacterized protein LOC105350603 n=1 Tax=Fragaria vesca subsp. vesca TaxID=101020 RepID=UPI0005CB39C1|nr:PREDICTED: uncharacterized protein LOC105350603 [Fragaria vesca subsp. vesca]
MAHPYDKLPYAVRREYFHIQQELPTPNPLVFNGIYIDDQRRPNPIDAHIYYEDKEDEALYWCQFMVTHNYCDNFIGVHACVRMTTPDGILITVLFTEKSQYSLRYWLDSNPEQLVTVNYDSDYIRFSSQLNKLLR